MSAIATMPFEASDSLGARNVVLKTNNIDEFAGTLANLYYPARFEYTQTDGPCSKSSLRAVASKESVVGIMRTGGEITIEPRLAATTYHVNIPIAGRLSASAGAEDVGADPDHAVVHSAERRHYLDSWARDTPLLSLKFGRGLVEGELEKLTGRSVLSPIAFDPVFDLSSSPEGRSWRRMATSLAQELHEPGSLYVDPIVHREYVRSLVVALLVAQSHSYSDWLAYGDRPNPRMLRRATMYIEEHSREPLTLADLAEIAGCGPRRLQETFRDYLNDTPMGYLRRVRLHDARDLIRDEGRPVTEAAYISGFTHLGRFAAAYRQQFGESPSQTARG
ncbi:MAG TPA: AraC family transcriptional regulator [Microbacteriaceae bacterium]|nr:AraC family transcriptional regulator [Microbacteriaceae bacterium]